MQETELLGLFVHFGLAGTLGFLIGLERQMGAAENPHAGTRDFVMFALIGAVSAYAAAHYANSWLVAAGLASVVTMIVSGYWVTSRKDPDADGGITTEIAAILTFFIGVVAMSEATVLAIAIAIVLLAILSQKQHVERLSARVERFELDAALKFLVISFIVLPVLPSRTLDTFVTLPIGTVVSVERDGEGLILDPLPGFEPDVGESVDLYTETFERAGQLHVEASKPDRISGRLEGRNGAGISPGSVLRGPLAGKLITTMLSALQPYKIWLIVVLVSFVSFVGYVLIKLLGTGAGIGLTGLIGGLASSTVTTLSFARRSKETPAWSENFAVAVILASSVMFPRLLLQIGVVNQALMRNMALPILVMGGTGIGLAIYALARSAGNQAEAQEVKFTNPFSLKSAVAFALVFSVILMVTRLAITYLGDTWLPVVAIVSGLTDADAIAFSLSDAQQAGFITLDWASFNLVLGALSNTFMKLFLVLGLGDRGLFRRLLHSFLIIGAVGIATMFLYYDVRGMLSAIA